MWHLELGSERIARLTEETFEFPWIYARLIDSPAFERFRVYFSDDASWPDTQEFENLCDEVRSRGGFVLRNMSTDDTYHHVTINQVGDLAWFRYS